MCRHLSEIEETTTWENAHVRRRLATASGGTVVSGRGRQRGCKREQESHCVTIMDCDLDACFKTVSQLARDAGLVCYRSVCVCVDCACQLSASVPSLSLSLSTVHSRRGSEFNDDLMMEIL